MIEMDRRRRRRSRFVISRSLFCVFSRVFRELLFSFSLAFWTDGKDWTPLMHAADQGHAEATEALLEMGANPLLLTEDTNNQPLDFAWDHNTRRALRLAMKRAKMAERAIHEAEQALQMAEMQAEFDLNQAAQAAVGHMLKDEALVAKLHESFNKFDKDGGGSIDTAEFGNACTDSGEEMYQVILCLSVNLPLFVGQFLIDLFLGAGQAIGKVFNSEEELMEIMEKFDQSGDGDISFSEFLDWWKEDAKEAWKTQQRANKDASIRLETSVGAVLSGGGTGA